MDLLSISEVRESALWVPGASGQEMFELYRVLSDAVMDSKIPHYKVVGIRVTGKYGMPENVVAKVEGANKSYAELIRDVRDLIFVKGGGHCIVGGEELPVSLTSNLSFMAARGHVTSSNGSIYYVGEGMKATAMGLVEDVEVIDVGLDCEILFVLRKGVGMCDFNESERILTRECSKEVNAISYIPVRAVYELSNLFAVRMYEESNRDCLQLLYKRKVNEEELTELIHGYAMSMSGGQDECKDTSY